MPFNSVTWPALVVLGIGIIKLGLEQIYILEELNESCVPFQRLGQSAGILITDAIL